MTKRALEAGEERQKKLMKLDDESHEKIIKELEAVQLELAAFNEEQEKEVNKMVEEIHEEQAPIYAKRGEIIKNIPTFWRRVISVFPTLMDDDSVNVPEIELKILDYLEDVQFRENQKERSFEFHFKENPYFTEKVLKKTVTEAEEEDDAGDLKMTIPEITWKDKNPLEENKEDDEFTFFNWLLSEFSSGNDFGNMFAENFHTDIESLFLLDDDEDDADQKDKPVLPEADKEKLDKINEEIQANCDRIVKGQAKINAKFEEKKLPCYTSREETFKKIPGFWKTVVEKLPMIAADEEKCALLYLESVFQKETLMGDDASLHEYTFTFAENPYFTNTTLVKKVTAKITDENFEEELSKCEIDWKKPEEGEEDVSLPVRTAEGGLFDFLQADKLKSTVSEFHEFFIHKVWENPLDIYRADPEDLEEIFDEEMDDDDDDDDDDEDDDEDEDGAEEVADSNDA